MAYLRILAFFAAPATGCATTSVKISVLPNTSLYDEKVAIVVEGLNAGEEVTLQLSWSASFSKWASAARFIADEHGKVDVTSMPAKSGSYEGVDPMGLFWSAEQSRIAAPTSTRRERGTPEAPYRMRLDAVINGRTVACATFIRKLQIDGLQGREVQKDGLYGVFFMPPAEKLIPGLLVLGGSGVFLRKSRREPSPTTAMPVWASLISK